MPSNESFPQRGLVLAGDDEPRDEVGNLARAVLEDIFYNIVHDIVLNTHREEKMARASSAAIVVEQMVEEVAAAPLDEIMETGMDPGIVKTEAAVYKHGEVTLTGNPLKDVHEIRCPKCGLPRLLHPTDGKGAKKPEPGIEYCKKRPFIDKPYFDIYGQTFVPEGPGRGKKKKDMVNPLKAQTTAEGTPNGSQDSPGISPPPNEGPIKPIPFPHAKCHNCNTFLPIKRMNNHMVKCIGGGGRDSSRTALLKIQNGNGNGNGSQNGTTPPGSRNGTPAPGANAKKGSPNKRGADEEVDSDSSPQKKKKIKKTAMTKLKAPKMVKSASQMSSSNLSFEQKVPNSDDEDVDMDDDNDGDFGTVVVEPKKKLKSMVKKGKENMGSKKKSLIGKGSMKPNIPSVGGPDVTKIKVKVKRAEGGDPEILAALATLSILGSYLALSSFNLSPIKSLSILTASHDVAPVAPNTAPADDTHPIIHLLLKADREFEQLLRKETHELASSASAYRARRGRHPPPGWDKWHHDAVDNDVIITGEFWDQIYHDLKPLWAFNQTRMRAAIKSQIEIIQVRNGKATCNSNHFWAKIWRDPWDERSDIFLCCGFASGERNKEENWKGSHRHRLVPMLNGTQALLMPNNSKFIDVQNLSLEMWQLEAWYQAPMKRSESMGKWLNNNTKVGFTGLLWVG
ncbi:Beta-1 [Hyphodiscus hymeniophilus]|uniref:Beta-1 n=1 Tax=Hyphodiscus hymeniophilus TaxID=353542 RepID=A0A9P6VC87_9HELO|nr:Beta-1 [Hyphodiscus hymeniophilus]